MAAHVMGRAAAQPDKTALSVLHPDASIDWTYAQIDHRIRTIAAGFLELGLKARDRVLLRLDNTPETPLAYLAAIAVDLIPVPTSSQLTHAETARIIDMLAPALILHAPGVPCPDHPGRRDVDILSHMHDLSPADYVMGDPNRPAYIVFTSGTSGEPRAVQHAHRAIWARQMMLPGWYDLHGDDRLMHAGAFNWTYTMGTGLMDPWSIGATSLIPAPDTEPEALPDLLREHRATIFAAAPGVYRKFQMSDNSLSLPDLRHALSAGEKLSPQIRDAWQTATGTPIFEAYGMSECSTFISANPATPAIDGAIGQPQPGRRIAILDEDGTPVPRDTPGTIAVHRDDPGLMLGYLNAPEATQARMKGDWFLTGDLGCMGADDQISYLGRADDMMNAGGYRVSPHEVEAALAHAPGIDTIAVTDIEVKPDVRVVMAFYTGAEPLDFAALTEYARTRLARYKQPRDYIHLPDLPTGPNGKLARKSLKSIWKEHNDQT